MLRLREDFRDLVIAVAMVAVKVAVVLALSFAVAFVTACGSEVEHEPGICHVLDADDGPLVIFRPCEDPDGNVCVTRILDGQTIHSMAETTDCRSCLSDRYTLTGTGVEFRVGGDDVDFACARYDG